MDHLFRGLLLNAPACLVAAGAAWAVGKLDPGPFLAVLLVGCWAGWSARKMKEDDARRMKDRVREALDELGSQAEQEAMGQDVPASDLSPRIIPIRGPFAPKPRSQA